MWKGKKIVVIIPAFNEAAAIGKVLAAVPAWVDCRIVANNGSTDATAAEAAAQGAVVIYEARKCYGYACMAALKYVEQWHNEADIIVFLDGDFSDFPEDMEELVAPIAENTADFVVGARAAHLREAASLTPQQIFGNWLATSLMRLLFHSSPFTDLGPFRAILYRSLLQLHMQDRTYGWTIEMQLKALRHALRCREVPVRYKRRIGVSKVSGTFKGSLLAGIKIIAWIARYGLKKD
ncbi:MAG: glycosyltransferase family 2 protein [Sphingobacteriales bacterium]|nr:glycosyltransferase family 2 protein [Sphingobacteriales bacterium]